MNHHGRSRRDHYREESQQDHYPSADYGAQRLSYPDAAAQLYQQNPMLAQVSRAHRNGMPQYAEEDVRYHGFNNVAQQVYYKQQQSVREEGDHRRERVQETRDDERYAELYEEVFAPNSRTTISGTRTSTERTRSTPVHTSSSRSTSRYTSFSSSSSESTWEDGGIFSALNDMAGNLKKIGGIHCSKAGPDSTEVQLKLNLPLPIVQEGFNNAMATLSPKKCGNMQYDYQHLDEHVVGMEERLLGTIDQIGGNIMPVYKSLFQSQSESSSSDDDDIYEDDDQSESTYEDPRFLSKVAPTIQQQQYETTNVVETPIMAQNVNGIPTQIIVSNQPSCVSSSDSWKMSSPRDGSHEYTNKFAAKNSNIKTISNNPDVAIRGSKHQSNESESNRRETAEMEKKAKSKPQNIKSNTEIPQVIKVKNEENVPECYSDLTTGVPSAEKEKSTSNVPAIKTQFTGDEIMSYNKASFQRNSIKKGTAGLNDLTDNEAVFVKSDPPTTKSASSRSQAPEVSNTNKRRGEIRIEEDDYNDEELEEIRQLREEREEAKKKLDEERKRFQVEERKRFGAEVRAKAMQGALKAKKLEEQVEAELKAAREALKENKLEADRKQREAEENAAEEALVAKIFEEERKQHEARSKAAEEAQTAKRLEEKRKRIEAEAKATQEALEANRLEGERKRREAEAKAAQEARKTKKLEEQRKFIEAETKAAQEALEALYAKKADEERRQREAEAKKVEEERKEREAKAEAKAEAKLKALEAKKLKKVRERVEAETKAAAEEYEKLEEERNRIVTETRAVKKSGKERKQTEVKTKPDPEEKGRTSLYKVQRFEDYCQSVAGTVDDIGEATRTKDDMYEDTSSVEERSSSSILESDGDSEEDQESVPSHEEESSTGTMSFEEQSNSRNSVDTYSSDEESDIYTDATSFVEDSDSKMAASVSDIRSNNTTERLRNRIDAQSENAEIKYPFSSEESVNTMDWTVQSSFSKSKYPMKKSSKLSSAYTSDVPIPIAATMSTMPTFDQGTVHSGQHSLGRFLKSSDESVVSSVGYSHHSITSAKPVALSVTALPRDTKKKNEIKTKSRSSILGSIVSFTLSLVLRVLFTIILFSYTWIKHLVIMIGKKQEPKIDCTPFELQPDQSIRREEIQDRSTDDLIHQNSIQQHRTPYLGYEDPNHHQEHYTTTMIIRPRGYMGDNSDEVGTCVESIVPDAHCPNMSDGKISAWKITQKNTETSSLSSPPSTSFRVLKSAYSALSSKRESEKSNWLDQPTIDDEMSYYE